MANEILRELQIDVARENTFQAILAKQYDKATRYILAEITNLGKPIAIDASSAVLINFSRPDKSTAAFAGEVVNGKVKVPIPYWALEIDGEVITDISLVGADNRLTTLSFTILVQPATYNGASVSEDENFDLLLQLLGQVSESKASAQAAEQSAINSANVAESAAQSAANAAETLSKAASDLEHAEEVIDKANGIFDGFTVQNTPTPNAIPQYNDKSNIKTSKPIVDNDCVRLADIVSLIQKGGIETGLIAADGTEITDENGETLFGYIKFNNA